LKVKNKKSIANLSDPKKKRSKLMMKIILLFASDVMALKSTKKDYPAEDAMELESFKVYSTRVSSKFLKKKSSLTPPIPSKE